MVLRLEDAQSKLKNSLVNPFTHTDVGIPNSFQTLLDIADEQIHNVPYNEVQPQWLRLYVEATIGWALCHVTDEREEMRSAAEILQVVGKLDMAIIMAGGVGREEVIEDLIRELQRAYIQEVRDASVTADAKIDQDVRNLGGITAPQLRSTGQHQDDREEDYRRPTKRRRIIDKSLETPATSTRPPIASQSIPILDSPPSIATFRSTHCKSPFILRNYLRASTPHLPFNSDPQSDSDEDDSLEWPALTRWKSATYILDTVGLGRIVPVELGKSYTDKGWGQKIVAFEDFLGEIGYERVDAYLKGYGLKCGGKGLEEIAAIATKNEAESGLDGKGAGADEERETDTRPMYLAQHDLFRQFPSLTLDFEHPPYVYSAPDPPANYPTYTPPGNEQGVITNAWVGSGSKQITSPAHTVSPGFQPVDCCSR